jgi:predicted RNA binding protein YcfA (HicA-like mRNA interferase family)
LSLLLAKFLGETPAEHRAFFDRARDLYKIRSKLAHGDKITTDEEAAAIEIVEFWTPEAEELARLSLPRMFEKQLVQHFNSRKLHEVFLTNLLFASGLDDAVGSDSWQILQFSTYHIDRILKQLALAVAGMHNEVYKALIRDGLYLRVQAGSHQRYRHPDARRVTVSFHYPRDMFPFKTLKSTIEDQARWTEADLRRLGLLTWSVSTSMTHGSVWQIFPLPYTGCMRIKTATNTKKRRDPMAGTIRARFTNGVLEPLERLDVPQGEYSLSPLSVSRRGKHGEALSAQPAVGKDRSMPRRLSRISTLTAPPLLAGP